MQLSFMNSERGNGDLISLEVNTDTNYEQFINAIQPVLGLKKSTTYDITVDGKTYTKEELLKAGSLKILNLKENDVVVLSPEMVVDLIEVDDNEHRNLIRSIRIPSNRKKLNDEITTTRDGLALYFTLKNAPEGHRQGARREFQRTYPGLYEQYQRRPNDKWAFLLTYRNCVMKMNAERDRHLHLAVQKEIESKAAEKRLQHNLQTAVNDNPEILIPVEMLYIKIRLNGVEGHAFVDTGAAKSLVSMAFVKKCGLTDFINPDHAYGFTGIGGNAASLGTIWQCDMNVDDHELPITLHVMDDKYHHEVLLGLDVLLRHRAIINLQDRTLTFNNEATTTFLTPREAAAYTERESAHMRTAQEESLKEALEKSATDEPMDTDQKHK